MRFSMRSRGKVMCFTLAQERSIICTEMLFYYLPRWKRHSDNIANWDSSTVVCLFLFFCCVISILFIIFMPPNQGISSDTYRIVKAGIDWDWRVKLVIGRFKLRLRMAPRSMWHVQFGCPDRRFANLARLILLGNGRPRTSTLIYSLRYLFQHFYASNISWWRHNLLTRSAVRISKSYQSLGNIKARTTSYNPWSRSRSSCPSS